MACTLTQALPGEAGPQARVCLRQGPGPVGRCISARRCSLEGPSAQHSAHRLPEAGAAPTATPESYLPTGPKALGMNTQVLDSPLGEEVREAVFPPEEGTRW